MVAKTSRFRKKKTSSLPKNIFAWGLIASILLLGFFLVFHNFRLYQKRAELKNRAQELQEEIAQLSARQHELDVQIETQGGEVHQEEILREQGLYKKPGEEVVTVLPPEEQEKEQQKEEMVWWNPFTWFSRE